VSIALEADTAVVAVTDVAKVFRTLTWRMSLNVFAADATSRGGFLQWHWPGGRAYDRRAACGSISVQSEVGQGTTFTVRLPIDADSASA